MDANSTVTRQIDISRAYGSIERITNGRHIATYASALAASRQTGLHRQAISDAARFNREYAGSLWNRVLRSPTVPAEPPTKRPISGIAVEQFSLVTGRTITRFMSVSEAARSLQLDHRMIRRCIGDPTCSYAGFGWRCGSAVSTSLHGIAPDNWIAPKVGSTVAPPAIFPAVNGGPSGPSTRSMPNRLTRGILQLDPVTDGIIARHRTQQAAATAVGSTQTMISWAINDGEELKGSRWCWEDAHPRSGPGVGFSNAELIQLLATASGCKLPTLMMKVAALISQRLDADK